MLGEANAMEAELVNKWLEEDLAHQAYYNQLQQIWESSKKLAATSSVDENRAWERFQQRTIKGKHSEKVQAKKTISWLKVAAAFAVFIGLGLVIKSIFDSNTVTYTTVAATNNVIIDSLMDGSVITLNKNSFIVYPEKFNGDKRMVSLTGEAFFNVAPDKSKPFVITVNDIQVTVVGTSFNIKSDMENAEVVVETGIVKVSRAGITTELIAGEKLHLTKADKNVVKEKITDKLYNYYRSKELACDDTPLWKVVQVLNEAYGANIMIERKELENLRINTTFKNESLDKILEVIHLTFDITVTRKEGKIILQ